MASTLHSQLPQPVQGVRRSATLPTKLLTHTRTNTLPLLEETEKADEIYYTHPSVTIKSFEPPTPQRSVPSTQSTEYDYPVDTIETLPWRSAIERTLSRGQLKIEMVPGSTAFFKTRDINRAILRNSQCWCVDRESKFVLRIARFKYWRLELPYQTDEDKKKADELKEVLPKLLRYEVTPCPFKRGFTVELPEDAKTPRKKRPWKRREAPKVIQQVLPKGEVVVRDDSPRRQQTASSGTSDEEDTDGDGTDDSGITPQAKILDVKDISEDNRLTEHPPIPIPRSITVPSQFLRDLHDSDPDLSSSPPDREVPEASSLSSSLDSFHSLHSFHSPTSPLPPPLDEPTAITDIDRTPIHKREISELTITGPTAPVLPITPLETTKSSSPPLRPSTPPNLDPSTESNSEDETFSEAITPGPDPQTTLRRRLRAKGSCHRTLSPMPPPSTIFTPSPRSPTTHITHAIIQRTCSFVLGPPIQFLAILFQIATRLASSDTSSNPNSTGRSQTSSGNIWLDAANARHRSQAEDLKCDVRGSDIGDEEGWGEDDFGVPLGGPISRPTSKNSVADSVREMGGSWEVD
jgi:hypothetical protein